MDYVGTERSPQRLSSEVDQELEANLLGKKTSDEKIDEIILSDSQFTIPDEMLPSLNTYQIQSIIIHPSANRQEEHEILDAKTSETVIEDHAQINKGITDLSSNSLVNSEVELATEEQVRIPPNTQEHIDVCLYYLRKKSKYGQHNSYKNEPNKSYKYSTVDCNFMNVIRSLNDVYSMDHQNLTAGGQEHHIIEYINGFRMHSAVPWHTVEDIFIPVNIKEKQHWVLAVLSFSERGIFLYDSYEFSGHYATVLAEIEKITMIIPLCLQDCDFYVKKGIDLQNHPRYKDKESTDIFNILFEDDLPQQLSGSLDYGVFMIMYAECLSYGHKVIATELDPNALRRRYAALLWNYGIRKQEANVISDVEAPLRPARQSRITSVTEVVDVVFLIDLTRDEELFTKFEEENDQLEYRINKLEASLKIIGIHILQQASDLLQMVFVVLLVVLVFMFFDDGVGGLGVGIGGIGGGLGGISRGIGCGGSGPSVVTGGRSVGRY
ncbi:hypothetical protein T459_30469 [Capsicum annuum]|uniref:Ubiquitin-like protease family profile domain-containing protein n=1 Tax=Capsicum annuum TaxID=4072 RepID=A0A2G2Y8J3_CAPAN|nr:hypothetical protein T459_30469 [Capsicum annuum]